MDTTPSDEPRPRRRWIEWIAAFIAIAAVIGLCIPAIRAAREAARREASSNNLKQIGLGLSNYHDVYLHFPPGGTFREDGVGLHGWPLLMYPYFEANAFYSRVEPTIPWDDPTQVDLFIQHRVRSVLNPGGPQVATPEGVPLIHYAANERLLHRNSRVSLAEIPNQDRTLLVADAFGEYSPWGGVWNWRNPTVPFRTSTRQFGGPSGDVTLVLFVDGHVEALGSEIDAEVFARLAGPTELRPAPELVERPIEPYRLPTKDFWRRLYVYRWGRHPKDKGEAEVEFRLSPDGKLLKALFASTPPKTDEPTTWHNEFSPFAKPWPIERVHVSGTLGANELAHLLEIPTLQRISLGEADIQGDAKAVLSNSRVIVDPGTP